jgi:hypothetical protein
VKGNEFMKKMIWVEPKVTNLSVEKTEYGISQTSKVDDTQTWNGHTYYSYES